MRGRHVQTLRHMHGPGQVQKSRLLRRHHLSHRESHSVAQPSAVGSLHAGLKQASSRQSEHNGVIRVGSGLHNLKYERHPGNHLIIIIIIPSPETGIENVWEAGENERWEV